MRIVLDCRSVFSGMGGIGRVTACLARELPAALPDARFALLFGSRRPEEPLVRAPNVEEVQADAAMIDPEFEQVRLPGVLDELEADLFHGTCFAVPIATDVPCVATVHDVVFRRRPELVEEGLRAHLDRWTDVACELARALVTVSEFSRREIAALYGRPADRIDVVPNAVDERFFAIARRPAREPFLLYVGALEAKKNVAALLRGFARLVRERPSLRHGLVLAGGGGGAPFDADAAVAAHPELRGRVRLLGHVPEAQLLELYGAADAFVYLSEYEGFGLPPLEAMAAGVPTLVADRASLPEVVADGALVVDPAREDEVARAFSALLEDARLRAHLARRGFEVARRFSWDASARVLASVYRRVLAPVRTLAGGRP